jgi:hypothetical protein
MRCALHINLHLISLTVVLCHDMIPTPAGPPSKFCRYLTSPLVAFISGRTHQVAGFAFSLAQSY